MLNKYYITYGHYRLIKLAENEQALAKEVIKDCWEKGRHKVLPCFCIVSQVGFDSFEPSEEGENDPHGDDLVIGSADMLKSLIAQSGDYNEQDLQFDGYDPFNPKAADECFGSDWDSEGDENEY